MAAFAAAVKIDAFAYMPVQDFGNAFSTFIAQNFGANKEDRIQQGLKGAVILALLFCVVISLTVWLFAEPLMKLFVEAGEVEIIGESSLSPYRRRILLWNRFTVSFIRPVQSFGKTWDVGSSHCYFAGHPSGFILCFVSDTCIWCSRNLVVYSYWMVSG